jgi:hypothetical protein
MEMEEFKDMVNKSADKAAPINNDVMKIIYADNKGPLATLEKKLKVTLYIFPFVVVLFCGRLFTKDAMQHISTAWLLFAILSLEFFISLFNYRVTKKLRRQEGSVKQNLINKVHLLQNRYNWYFRVHNVMILLMAILLEITMYYHWDTNFDGWGHVNILLRIFVYIIFFVAQYLVKHHSQKKQYGQYLEKLQTLAGQVE